MRFVLFVIMIALLAYLATSLFVRADVRTLARRARPVGIGLALILGLVFLVTGRPALAQRLLAGALAFMGPFSPFSGSGRQRRTRGGGGRQTSQVRTSMLDMELDHGSGEMAGTVIAGRFAGRALGEMSPGELGLLHTECRSAQDQSAVVLEAYLERYHPGWRDDPAFDGSGGSSRARSDGHMSREEAYEILGLSEGASVDAIRKAHRRLMKQYHPDQGGSDYLAAKINEAKNRLLDGR